MPRQRTGTLVFKRASGFNARIWVEVRDELGGTRQERKWVPLGTYDRDLAKRKLRKIVAGLASGEIVADGARAEARRELTVVEYGRDWTEGRKAARVVMATDEETILTKRIYPVIGGMRLREVRPAFIAQILEELAKTHSHESVKKTRSVLDRLLEAAWKSELIPENPVNRVDMPEHTRIDERERTILTDEQVQVFLNGRAAGPNGRKPRADAEGRLLELKVMAVCSRVLGGMRTAEVNRWDFSMWDLVGYASVKIQRAKAKRGRTGKVQTLIVPEPMRPVLRAWHEQHGSPPAGPVFPVTKGARKGHQRAARGVSYAARLRRELWRIGIRDHAIHFDTPTSKRVDWHSFRRAFATSLAEAGVNEQRARLLTAHDSSVHARYVQQTKAMQVIPDAVVPTLGAFNGLAESPSVTERSTDVANDTTNVFDSSGHARRDSNPRHSASKADALSS